MTSPLKICWILSLLGAFALISPLAQAAEEKTPAASETVEESAPPLEESPLTIKQQLPAMPVGFWNQTEEPALIDLVNALPEAIASPAIRYSVMRSLSTPIDRDDLTADLLELRLAKATQLQNAYKAPIEPLTERALDVPSSLMRISADDSAEVKRRAMLAYALKQVWLIPSEPKYGNGLLAHSFTDAGLSLSTSWREMVNRAFEGDKPAEAFFVLMAPLSRPLNEYQLHDIVFIVQSLRNLRLEEEAIAAAYEGLMER